VAERWGRVFGVATGGRELRVGRGGHSPSCRITNQKVSKATSVQDVAEIGIVEEASHECGESLQAAES
jgi:hypothetical protein